MKDSQRAGAGIPFFVSISRRIMKDSQPARASISTVTKYIKANNERFSTVYSSSYAQE